MRYASAFVDIAEQSKNIDSVSKDMDDLEAMFESSEDFQSFAKSPLLAREEKERAVRAIAEKAKLQDITTNFLCLLAQNRRMGMLPEMIAAVRADISARRGEVVAKIKSAFPLEAAQQQEIEKTLAKAVGKNVAVTVEIDKDLIGGMVVTVGSQMYDASVKRKLERLKIKMMSGAGANVDAA
jgi:F-type H+-transporting ATPase subunit delta